MSLPNVNISLSSGALGVTAQTTDGIAGLILSGVAVSGSITLNTPKQVFSLQNAVDLVLN